MHRLKKLVKQKLAQNKSWCSKSQQERQAQAGENCGAKANAEYQADDGKDGVAKAIKHQAQAGETCWAEANAEREADAGEDGVTEASAEEAQAGKACKAS